MENEKVNGDGREKVEKDKQLRPNVDTLLDICSRNVAEFVPFQYIEERYQYRIPGKEINLSPKFYQLYISIIQSKLN